MSISKRDKEGAALLDPYQTIVSRTDDIDIENLDAIEKTLDHSYDN